MSISQFGSYNTEDRIVSRNHLSMRYNQEKWFQCEGKEPEMTSLKSQLSVAFGTSGRMVELICLRTGHNE